MLTNLNESKDIPCAKCLGVDEVFYIDQKDAQFELAVLPTTWRNIVREYYDLKDENRELRYRLEN